MLTIETRPKTFSDVVGQDKPLTVLRAVLASGDVPSTFLLTGAFGSGKTSSARILAAMVNCEKPANADACGECNSCVTIAAGTSDALVEIDSAVYGSAENVRTLTELVELAVPRNYRVVILDEAHALSKVAFNALLKVMEEAPTNVIFVLVTTELEKVPLTVQSRAVSFYFGPVSETDIFNRLKSIADNRSIEYTTEGMQLLARLAPSLRDSVKNLQVISSSLGTITKENVAQFMGDVELVRVVLRKVLNNLDADEELDAMFSSCPPLMVVEETVLVLSELYHRQKISSGIYAKALEVVWTLASLTVFDSRSKLITRLALRRLGILFEKMA